MIRIYFRFENSKLKFVGCLCDGKTGPHGNRCTECDELFQYLVLEPDNRTRWEVDIEIQRQKVSDRIEIYFCIYFGHLQLKRKADSLLELMEWELDRIATSKKLVEEERLEREKQELQELKKKEAEDNLFYDLFEADRFQYPLQLKKMINDDYHADSG